MTTLERFNCDHCDKSIARGHFIRPIDNSEHDYHGTIYVCNECKKELTE